MTSQPAGPAQTVKASDPQPSPAAPRGRSRSTVGKARKKQRTFAVASWFTKGYDQQEVDDFFSRAQAAYEAARAASAVTIESGPAPSSPESETKPEPETKPESETKPELGTASHPTLPPADAAQSLQPEKSDQADRAPEPETAATPNPVVMSKAAATPGAADVLPKGSGKDSTPMTADDVRKAAFTLRRRGYAVAEVDAALDRLEDALAAAEREGLLTSEGEQALIDQLTKLADTLRGRLERPDGQRFARGIRGWERTYDVREVDLLCHRLNDYFGGVEEMSVDEVRRAAFRARRGNLGYREPVVDAFLDRVVTVMSAVD